MPGPRRHRLRCGGELHGERHAQQVEEGLAQEGALVQRQQAHGAHAHDVQDLHAAGAWRDSSTPKNGIESIASHVHRKQDCTARQPLRIVVIARVCIVFDGSAAEMRRRGIEEAQRFAMFLKLKMDRKVE